MRWPTTHRWPAVPRAAGLALAVAAAACTSLAPGIRAPDRGDAVEGPHDPAAEAAFDPEIREITPSVIAQHHRERAGRPMVGEGHDRAALTADYGYRVGVGDVLMVIVWDHPELTNPAGVTTGGGGLAEQGRLVREDGTFFFPLVGSVEAEGRSVDEIREELAEGLATYIDDPQVDVRVSEYRSQRVYVTGEVVEPGPQPVDDRPLTILDAVSRAGGFAENADRRRAYLTRGDEQRTIDILALYETGARDDVMTHGDILHIPDNHFNQVIVMGEVIDQTRVPLHEGRLSLAEAIGEAQGIDLTTADTSRILVVRGEPVHDERGGLEGIRPLVYYLDSRQASDLLLAEGFQLRPRDIVFVPATTAVRINRAVEQFLPQITDTLQAIWMTQRFIRD